MLSAIRRASGKRNLAEQIDALIIWLISPIGLEGVASRLGLMGLIFGSTALFTLLLCAILTLLVRGLIVH